MDITMLVISAIGAISNIICAYFAYKNDHKD